MKAELKFRILFIGYWNADDGLTSSTIVPHLKILKKLPSVESLYFTNTQRERVSEKMYLELVESTDGYFPLFSKNLGLNFFTKIGDFIFFPKQIETLCRQLNINYLLARGAPAGSLALKVASRLKIPFAVESFEPHADYMRISTVWRWYDPRYLFQKHWESVQKRKAQYLIVVAHRYKKKLMAEGIEGERIMVAPCAVDAERFFPEKDTRNSVRMKLGIPQNAIVGVYAGKFGGLYYEDRAFEIFRACFKNIENFSLILLTSHDRSWINDRISAFKLPPGRIRTLYVEFDQMNRYLNVADFGFALYKSNFYASFLSPVKVGEYWAVNLPVLMTKGVGDEADFLQTERLGIVINRDEDVRMILPLIGSLHVREKGLKIRNFGVIHNIYNQIFS